MPDRNQNPIVIRVTGGIGSGKSALCDALAERGAMVFNADSAAKSLMGSSSELKSSVIRAFGEQAYDPDGTLNRAYLANIVFNDDRSLMRLNSIVHPAVFSAFDGIRDAATAAGTPFLVYEAALLTDRPGNSPFDVTVVVDSPPEERLARVQRRDNVSAAAVQSRIEQQPTRQEYLEVADYVVINEGSLTDLANKADELLRSIDENFGQRDE